MPVRLDKEEHQQRTVTLLALQPRQAIPEKNYLRVSLKLSLFSEIPSVSKQILRSKRVLHIQDTTRPTGQIALSDRMDEWIPKQNTLIKVASEKQSKTDHHALVEYDPAVTEYPINSYLLFIPPLAIAQQNEHEFVVESITGHRGNRQRRSTMEFKVRWAGFGESCDSGEPYKALLHVDKLHDYLPKRA
jgi:hypothetical protein